MKRKFLLLMIVSMLLTGCYDKTETEERLYVVLMGIDGRSIPESLSLIHILLQLLFMRILKVMKVIYISRNLM